jgi:hypothetical protein
MANVNQVKMLDSQSKWNKRGPPEFVVSSRARLVFRSLVERNSEMNAQVNEWNFKTWL